MFRIMEKVFCSVFSAGLVLIPGVVVGIVWGLTKVIRYI